LKNLNKVPFFNMSLVHISENLMTSCSLLVLY